MRTCHDIGENSMRLMDYTGLTKELTDPNEMAHEDDLQTCQS